MTDFDAYSNSYLTDSGFEDQHVLFRRRALLEALGDTNGKTFLEIGCGKEPLFNTIQNAKGFTVIEPVTQFVKIAQKHAKGSSHIRVLQGMLEQRISDLLGGQYDIIVASSVLHEVKSPEAMLQSIRALCGSSTQVHVIVPNAMSLHRLLAVEMGLLKDCFEHSLQAQKFQRQHTFDVSSLRSCVEAQGFAVASSTTFFLKPLSNAQMQQIISSQLVPAGFLDALYSVSQKYFREYGSEIHMELRIAE